ncbi:MAG: hypothetical protein VXX53_09860, partial [Pseudomonadota bacterium]|nr:hypothetical protein [Pseudomonadota bacterium]
AAPARRLSFHGAAVDRTQALKMLGHGSVMKFMTKPGRPKHCAKFNQGNDFGDIDRLIAATSIRTAKKRHFRGLAFPKRF